MTFKSQVEDEDSFVVMAMLQSKAASCPMSKASPPHVELVLQGVGHPLAL
jgi:hypothetical protein